MHVHSNSPTDYVKGENVWYRNHFKELIRWIPCKVVKKLSALRYLIELGGNIRMVHINQIRRRRVTVVDYKLPERLETTSDKIAREVPNHKRSRSESTSPPVRRSDRLKGQPPFKYPK